MKPTLSFDTGKQIELRDYTPIPTIKPRAPLDPKTVKLYSASIQRAVRYRNKADLRRILTSCTNKQRQQIRIQYQRDYDHDLCADIKKEFHGDFQELILSLILQPVELICWHLNRAMTGLVVHEKTIVELLVPRSNAEIRMVLEQYENIYKRPLVEHVCSSTSKHLRRLLTLILTSQRDESTETDDRRARDLAAELYTAAEIKHSKDHTIFNRILSRESFSQLRLLFDQYEEISGGNTIEEAVASVINGDAYDGIIAIIECVRYVPGFFAGCIFRALKNWSTDDRALIRLLVTRSEIDLENIKETYQKIYNKDLVKEIKVATTGEYKCALLALLGIN